MYDGLVVVDKPAGFTSHDVVAKLRKAYGQKRVGHAGTLDPDATGVLLVGLGRVTRLLRYLQETTKVYRGTIAFGVATDTLDAAGAVLERRPMPVTGGRRARRDARASSATSSRCRRWCRRCKVGGRRLHELARAGEEVERKPRPVRIDRFDARGVRARARTRRRRCSSSARAAPTSARWPPTSVPRSGARPTSRRCGACGSGRSRSTSRTRWTTIEADPGAALLTPGRGDARRWSGRRSTPSPPARSRTARCSRASPFAVDGPGPVRGGRRAGDAARGLRAAGRGLKPAVGAASGWTPTAR